MATIAEWLRTDFSYRVASLRKGFIRANRFPTACLALYRQVSYSMGVFRHDRGGMTPSAPMATRVARVWWSS